MDNTISFCARANSRGNIFKRESDYIESTFLTTNICMLWNVYFSIEAHIGYDFPWSFGALLPFGLWGGPIKHDMHHLKPRTNFQPFFTYLDKIFGTDSDAQRCEKFDPLKRQKKLLHDNLKKGKIKAQ